MALAAILAIAFVLRAMHLAQPIRFDEAVTWLDFARFPLGDAIARYHLPSNHVFHTVLVKVAAGVFGSEPWALRLPAFVAGLAVVPASYAVARVLYGGGAALFTAALVASSGTLTLYSTNARGYTMVVLAFLLLVLVGARIQQASSLRLWAAFAVIAALGTWAIPVMLFPLGAVALWLALSFLVDNRRADLVRLAVTIGATAVLTVAAYIPVLTTGGLDVLVRNPHVTSSPWPTFLLQLATSSWEALVAWSLGVPPLLTGALAACAVFALSRHAKLSQYRVSRGGR